MNDMLLQTFKDIARAMDPAPHDWQWVGQHASQRMFGITECRAKRYAASHGGIARKMVPE